MMDYRATTMTNEPECEAPIEPIRDKLTMAMGTLKELIIAMDDVYIMLFGKPATMPPEAPQDPDCMDAVVNIIVGQAGIAMGKFMDMRKRML